MLQDPLSQLLKFLEFFNAKKGHQSLSSQEEAAGSKDLSQSYSLQVAMYGLVFQIYFDKVSTVEQRDSTVYTYWFPEAIF